MLSNRFKRIDVEIEGIAPLLMHRFSAQSAEQLKSRTRKGSTNHKSDDPKIIAENAAYRDPKTGELYIPSYMIHAAMRNAVATDMKLGRSKQETRQRVAGGIYIAPEKLFLGTKDYKIQEDVAVNHNNQARVLVYRPRIDKWKLKFTIYYDARRLNPDFIRALLEEAGIYSGIGAHRPLHGRFKVVSFEPK